MAYVNFDSLVNGNNSGSGAEENRVGFFSLKNDGDEAIVRFMHDDTSSFEIIGTHAIQINGKFRRVSCIRTAKDPLDKCPLCESGDPIQYRFYIHLLEYKKNPDGSVSAEPKIWERSISYANKLKEYINNYGPMSDIICKIVRHGKAGDMKTDYEIIPNLNKQIYRDDIFVKKSGCFDGYKVLGGVVLDKSESEIKEFLSTGNFPFNNQEENKQNNTPVMTPNTGWDNSDFPTWSADKTTPKSWGSSTESPEVTHAPAWGAVNEQVTRPTRF